ncbi:MAG: hypothetical protein HXL35_06980 [Prevotellaceae bacterium]|nr:hypothetical protein [Prevotellaceae bacterium]
MSGFCQRLYFIILVRLRNSVHRPAAVSNAADDCQTMRTAAVNSVADGRRTLTLPSIIQLNYAVMRAEKGLKTATITSCSRPYIIVINSANGYFRYSPKSVRRISPLRRKVS